MRVVPLSRAGQPEVAAIELPPPAVEPDGGEGGGAGGGGGSGGDDGGGEGAPGSARDATELRVTRILLRGRRLVVRARVTPRADGGRLRLVLKGGGRKLTRSARIRRGRAAFEVRLSARRLRSQFSATVVYPGGRGVRRDAQKHTFARR